MAVCLSGLTGFAGFDTVGKPALFGSVDEFEKKNLFSWQHQASATWNDKRTLLLHLVGSYVGEIFRTIPGREWLQENNGVAQWLFQIEEE